MTLLEFKNQHSEALKKAAGILTSQGINIKNELFSDEPYISSSIVNKKEGIYFKVNQYSFLSNQQKYGIQSTFPIKISHNNKNYRLNLLSISDYDWDDDRSWEPSISMEVIINGKMVF